MALFLKRQERRLYVVIRVKVSLVVRLQGRLQNSRLFSQNQSELA